MEDKKSTRHELSTCELLFLAAATHLFLDSMYNMLVYNKNKSEDSRSKKKRIQLINLALTNILNEIKEIGTKLSKESCECLDEIDNISHIAGEISDFTHKIWSNLVSDLHDK